MEGSNFTRSQLAGLVEDDDGAPPGCIHLVCSREPAETDAAEASVRRSVGASHHSPLISRKSVSYAGLTEPSSRTRPLGALSQPPSGNPTT